MYKYAAAIGVDIGSYSLRIAVLNIEGDLLLEDSSPLKPKQDKDYLILSIEESIRNIRKQAAAKGINPICIGIAAKGFIDHNHGIVLGPEHGVAGWRDVQLSKILNRETGLPVFVGNDANLMTIAEHKYGAAKGFKNVVFIALRTGIGGGIIIDGKLYRGMNNAGGEIGQMIINYKGKLSDVGIRGSLEYYASAYTLVRRFLEESGITNQESEDKISAKDIFELYYAGDHVAKTVVIENARMVGIGVANLMTIFAPEIVVIGGGMGEAQESYHDIIRESAYSNSLENYHSVVKIERALLGSKGSLLGGAYYALTRLGGKTF